MMTKKQIGILSVAAVATLIVATTMLVAQAPGHMGQGGPHGGSHGKMLHRAMSRLDLTDDQKVEIHDILMTSATGTDADRERMGAARVSLFEAMHAALFDERSIRDAYAQVAELEADRAVARARAFQQIRSVLDPDQLEELEAMREDMHERYGEEHRSGHGHGDRAHGHGSTD